MGWISRGDLATNAEAAAGGGTRFLGAWNATTLYGPNDVVTYAGAMYQAADGPALGVAPRDQAVTNLVTNPSIEVDTTGWGVSSCTIARDTTLTYQGVASLAATAAATVTATAGPVFAVSGLAAAQAYTAQARVRVGAGGATLTDVRLRLEWQPGTTYVEAAGVVVDDAGWTLLTVTGVAPAGTTSANLRVVPNTTAGGWPTGHTFVVDAVMVQRGSAVSAYFDGATPGCVWTGTAHASTSYRTVPAVNTGWRPHSPYGAAGLALPAMVPPVEGCWFAGTALVPGGVLAGTALPLGTLRLTPMALPVDTTIEQIAVNVSTTGNAANTCRLGVYAPGGDLLPGQLLYDLGLATVHNAALGVKAVTLPGPLTLPAGLYWLGVVPQGSSTAPQVSQLTGTSPYYASLLAPTSANQFLAPSAVASLAVTGVTGALPADLVGRGATEVPGHIRFALRTAIGPVPTYLGAGTTVGGTEATYTPGLPAGIAEGDILIAHLCSYTMIDATVLPAGYTKLGQTGYQDTTAGGFATLLAYKRVGPAEAEATFTRADYSTVDMAVTVHAVRGGPPTGDPIVTCAFKGHSNAPGYAPAVTVSQRCLLLHFALMTYTSGVIATSIAWSPPTIEVSDRVLYGMYAANPFVMSVARSSATAGTITATAPWAGAPTTAYPYGASATVAIPNPPA